jgi:hypothetical protein
VSIVFRLSDMDGGRKVVIGQGGIKDRVTGLPQVGRFHTARDTVPTVEKEDLGHNGLRNRRGSNHCPAGQTTFRGDSCFVTAKKWRAVKG